MKCMWWGYKDRYINLKDNDDLEEIIPQKISESGLFSDIQNKIYSPGIIPYNVNSPLWSDGAKKDRFLALPDTSKITFSSDGHWQFPEDAVLVKNFAFEMEKGNPASKKLVETRFLVKRHGDEQWDGYSYEWNDDQSDAELLPDSKTKQIIIKDADAPGGQTLQNYYFPSRTDCGSCHTPAAGYVLGVKTAQLNGNYKYGVITDNQLRSLNHIKMFTTNIGENYSSFPKFADPSDSTFPLSDRARSYLDANCSQCHQQNGTGRADFDLRASLSLEDTKLLESIAGFGNIGTSGRIIDPNSPETSVLYLRITRTDSLRMPRLATSVVDAVGTKVIYDWIKSLEPSGIIDNSQGIPDNYELLNAYPNPFNPSTVIGYRLPTAGHVTLKVYDILGRLVSILVDEYKQAGSYHSSFNAQHSTLTSGIYFYRMQAGNFIETKKIILMK